MRIGGWARTGFRMFSGKPPRTKKKKEDFMGYLDAIIESDSIDDDAKLRILKDLERFVPVAYSFIGGGMMGLLAYGIYLDLVAGIAWGVGTGITVFLITKVMLGSE